MYSAILFPDTVWRFTLNNAAIFSVFMLLVNSTQNFREFREVSTLFCAPCFRETTQPTGALLSLHEVSREASIFPFEVVPRAHLSLVNYSGS